METVRLSVAFSLRFLVTSFLSSLRSSIIPPIHPVSLSRRGRVADGTRVDGWEKGMRDDDGGTRRKEDDTGQRNDL